MTAAGLRLCIVMVIPSRSFHAACLPLIFPSIDAESWREIILLQNLHIHALFPVMPKPLFELLTAPNGRLIEQPLGLFINNEWREAKSGDSITVISPM